MIVALQDSQAIPHRGCGSQRAHRTRRAEARFGSNSGFSATDVCAFATGGTATAAAMLATFGIMASLQCIRATIPIKIAAGIFNNKRGTLFAPAKPSLGADMGRRPVFPYSIATGGIVKPVSVRRVPTPKMTTLRISIIGTIRINAVPLTMRFQDALSGSGPGPRPVRPSAPSARWHGR